MPKPAGFLAPYRVLDLTDHRGLLAGRMLAQLGADVIQIEPPSGSPARAVGPFDDSVQEPHRSLYWAAYAACKRGVTCDLDGEAGRALLRRLVEKADFIIESETPGVMAARGLVDVLIPRGGAGLIEAVVTGSQVPVIETGTGNCHLFVDEDADIAQAVAIMLNAKTQRPSVCNALETLLVHEAVADRFYPVALDALARAGVTVHGDDTARRHSEAVVPVTEDDFASEWLSLDLSVRTVADLDQALDHIRSHSTGHSETIVTRNSRNADRFTSEVDAAVVLVNASSRFVDGGEFGFGAEIGISTQKLHARGPMGLQEMTSTKYVVNGDGQTRA